MGNGEKVYKASRTTLKVIVILGQVLAVAAGALLTATPATWDTFTAAWPALIMAAAIGAWKAVENVRKNLYPDGPAWEWGGLFRRLIGMTPLILLCCLVACSTVGTKFRETVTENGVTSTTLYEARSLAGPLGKLDTTSHKWQYKWGGPENQIRTGQDSAGIDNSAQSVLVQAFEAVLGPLIMRIPLPSTVPNQPALETPESLPRPFVVPLK